MELNIRPCKPQPAYVSIIKHITTSLLLTLTYTHININTTYLWKTSSCIFPLLRSYFLSQCFGLHHGIMYPLHINELWKFCQLLGKCRCSSPSIFSLPCIPLSFSSCFGLSEHIHPLCHSGIIEYTMIVDNGSKFPVHDKKCPFSTWNM